MRPSTLVRLAASGTRTDTVRHVMTAFGASLATLGWLCAATVAALGFAGANLGSAGENERYTSDLLREPGLRPGVVATFILLTIPVLALVAQCSRLGAPARDRRIAAIRLAGATPSQAAAIGAGESAASTLLGSAVGVAAYFVLRRLLDHVNSRGERTLPTDVLPAPWAIVMIALTLPVVAALLSGWLLRRVTTGPLGVVQRVRRRHAPRPWPGVLLVAGLVLFAVIGPIFELLSRHGVHVSGALTVTIFYVGVLMVTLGVTLGAGWLSYVSGLALRRFGRRPAAQLAAARMIADPWHGSRTFGVLVVAAVFGGATAAVYQYFATMAAADQTVERMLSAAVHDPYVPQPNTSYTGPTLLVAIAVGVAVVIAALGQLVAVSEAIVSRRRTYAALVATGVPRSVLARTQFWQSLTAAVPAFLLAGASGAVIVRSVFGTTIHESESSITVGTDGPAATVPAHSVHVPIPWVSIGVVVGGSIAAVAVTVAIGLLFLKASTSVEELRTA